MIKATYDAKDKLLVFDAAEATDFADDLDHGDEVILLEAGSFEAKAIEYASKLRRRHHMDAAFNTLREDLRVAKDEQDAAYDALMKEIG